MFENGPAEEADDTPRRPPPLILLMNSRGSFNLRS